MEKSIALLAAIKQEWTGFSMIEIFRSACYLTYIVK